MEKSTHTQEYAILCSQLKAVRESAGFSQRELAARLQVPHSWIAKVEMGERRIDLVEFCWFISACGIDPVAISEKLLREIQAGRMKRQPSAKGDRK